MTSVVVHIPAGKPRVFKRDGMWYVHRPSYSWRRFLRWEDALECAFEWWC